MDPITCALLILVLGLLGAYHVEHKGRTEAEQSLEEMRQERNQWRETALELGEKYTGICRKIFEKIIKAKE